MLVIANFAIVIYFSMLLSFNYFGISSTLIDVFRELLSIPFLIAQFVFLGIGIPYVIKHRSQLLTLLSVLALALCTIITVGSFL